MMAKPDILARRTIILLGIFGLALLIRALYLFEFSRSPQWDLLYLDTFTHDRLARLIAESGSIGDEPFFRAPLYPYLLGLSYSVFGPGLMIPRVVNALFGAGTCVLTYLIGERLFRPGVGLLAALLSCVYWVLVFFDGELLLVSFFLFMVMLSFHLLLSSERRRRFLLSSAGLAIGLAAITRPNILAFLPLPFAWLAGKTRRGGPGRGARLAFFFLPALLPILLVTVRNAAIGGDPVLIAYQGGINFFLGNNPGATGRSVTTLLSLDQIPETYREENKSNPWSHEEIWLSSRYVAEGVLGPDPRPSEIQSFWLKEAGRFVREHPGDFARLTLKKAFYWINAYEIPSNKDLYAAADGYSALLRRLLFLDFGIVVSLGLLGMLVTMGRWRQLYLLMSYVVIYAVTTIVFFINARFRAPTIPILLLVAAAFLFWSVDSWRARRWRKLLLAGVPLGLLLLITHSNALEIRDPRLVAALHYDVATALVQRGRLSDAVDEFKASIESAPAYGKSFENLCRVLNRLRRSDEALDWARRGLASSPSSIPLRLELAESYAMLDSLDRAVDELEAILRQDEANARAATQLGIIYYLLGDVDAAENRFRANLALPIRTPDIDYVAHLHLGLIEKEKGRPAAALEFFREAVATAPHRIEGLLQLAAAQADLGQLGEARESLGRVLELDPDNSRALELISLLPPVAP